LLTDFGRNSIINLIHFQFSMDFGNENSMR
jgi:hypothetical protein